MGCCLDLEAGTVTFYRNGQSLGVAYDRVRTLQPSLAYFPAVSLSHTERCSLNFGSKPFVYPVQGYQPLQTPPDVSVTQEAQYYCSCLARLCLVAAGRPEGPVAGHYSDSTAAAAADSTKINSIAVADGPAQQRNHAAAAAAERLSAVGFPASSCSPRTSASSFVPPFAGSIADADVVLLGAILLQPLQQLLVYHTYLIHSVLLPMLADVQRESEPQASRQLQLLLQLLVLVWHEEFGSIMLSVLEELAYR